MMLTLNLSQTVMHSYMVVRTRSRVRFTPTAVSKLVTWNQLVRWPMMLAMMVGRWAVRKEPPRLRRNPKVATVRWRLWLLLLFWLHSLQPMPGVSSCLPL